MPRRPRLSLPDVPHHIIQRGNNRDACFYADEDYQFYLQWLEEYAVLCGCSVHAYVLMTNHVHLLVTPDSVQGLGNLMKRLGQRYVQYINRTYRRSGTLWEGRFKSCLTAEEDYVLACSRYIEMNPVRACMVEHPADYRWSSYRVNAQGESSTLLSPHEVYLRLGRDEKRRQSAYRALFSGELENSVLDEIRHATNGNYALGSQRFVEQVEYALGRRACRGVPGRPVKYVH